MIVKKLIALYQVRVNLLEHDCRLLMSWEQLSIPAWGVFQDTGKTKLRRRYLGSNEYAERVWSKKQVFGQAKKNDKTFLEELLLQQTCLTNSFLVFCLTEELVYFKKYTVVVKQRYWDSKPFSTFGVFAVWKKYWQTSLKTLANWVISLPWKPGVICLLAY